MKKVSHYEGFFEKKIIIVASFMIEIHVTEWYFLKKKNIYNRKFINAGMIVNGVRVAQLIFL